MNRRDFISASALSMFFPSIVFADDFSYVDTIVQRIRKILDTGKLPYIDIQSSVDHSSIDIRHLTSEMDRLGIAAMAASPHPYPGSDNWSNEASRAYPGYFIRTGQGGIGPMSHYSLSEFISKQAELIKSQDLTLLGEYEIRHYPSHRQWKAGKFHRDISIDIRSDAVKKLFSLSQNTGIPFQIHYEIEDQLLDPLDQMLSEYPGAKVIWCHFAQIRYSERAQRFDPKYVRTMIEKHNNLYFDTAFGSYTTKYPANNQLTAKVWNGRRLDNKWKDVIVDHPYRFLSALDLGPDRVERLSYKDSDLREFLDNLPKDIKHIVAYKSAMKLLFNVSV